ncbi:copper amine oxidase N-terminal domain-containing protein [Clostridiaceae bacterium M8S5]|nr:copper amine oxidase N-terminal domain-containing protein [Clostridiaceae bacterium M8S5]
MIKKIFIVGVVVLLAFILATMSFGGSDFYIVHDDQDYIYLKQNNQITKIHKSLYHDREYMTKQEQIDVLNEAKKPRNSEIQGESVPDENIKIIDNILYHNEIKIMDIGEYIDYNNRFYEIYENDSIASETRDKKIDAINEGKRLKVIKFTTNTQKVKKSPIKVSVYRYKINEEQILYKISTSAAMYNDYSVALADIVLTNKTGDTIAKFPSPEGFGARKCFVNDNGIIFLYGKIHYGGIHNDGGSVIKIAYKEETKQYTMKNIKDSFDCEKLRMLGIYEGKAKFVSLVEEGLRFYEMGKDGKMVKLNNTVPKEYDTDIYYGCYIDIEGEIFYIGRESNRLTNSTTGDFTKLRNYTRVKLDNDFVWFNEKYGFPFIDENDRTQVPIRVVMEKFGATVEWNNEKRVAIVKKDNIKIEIPIDEKYILKNGEKISNDTKALVKLGRTYLPIRVVMEAFGCEVKYDKRSNIVVIKTCLN